MNLFVQLGKTIGIWLVAAILIILIVLVPRNDIGWIIMPDTVVTSDNFSYVEYKQSILIFTHHLWTEKSIGNNRYGAPVEQDIKQYLPTSLSLIIVALFISIIVGLLKGIYDFRGSIKGKYLGQGVSWIFQSIPDFLLILIIQLSVFSLWNAGFLPRFSLYGNDMWYNYVLIAILLSIYPALYIARITSSTLSGQEDMQYIQTAKAKGLLDKVVLYKHMLGNCWASIFSHLSSLMLIMLSNLLIVEYLMFFPGAADRLYKAMGFHRPEGYMAASYEPYVVIAFALCFMLLVLITQIISQITRYFVDPRIREGEQA